MPIILSTYFSFANPIKWDLGGYLSMGSKSKRGKMWDFVAKRGKMWDNGGSQENKLQANLAAMEIQEALQWTDELIFTTTGKHLDSLQRAILEGAWQGKG